MCWERYWRFSSFITWGAKQLHILDVLDTMKRIVFQTAHGLTAHGQGERDLSQYWKLVSSIFPSTILSCILLHFAETSCQLHCNFHAKSDAVGQYPLNKVRRIAGGNLMPFIFQESASSAELSWPCVWCWVSWRDPQWCGQTYFLCGWPAPKIKLICGGWGPLSVQKSD